MATEERGRTGMRISLAIDRYDRHLPFFDGTLVLPAGLHLEVLQVGQSNTERDGQNRHRRMLEEGEFDAAEVSFSSYVMARARGLPFTAIPAFPRRLFSQTQMFVHAGSKIAEPRQLEGRRVGLKSFQNTLAVQARGDLAHEYGVDLRSIRWVVAGRETIEFDPPGGWQIDHVPGGSDPGAMLADGLVDALFYSRVPASLAAGGIRRLFPDPRAACVDYHAGNGFMPIMHVIAIRDDVIAADPGVPAALLGLYGQARAIASTYFDDPGWSQLPWAQLERECQASLLRGDLWPVGFSANRDNVERFIGYSRLLGLIDRQLAARELFHPSVTDT
jgi:4,5-dihydroxyphthalate decarboxylase